MPCQACLCPIVEGVKFVFVHGGRHFRGLVPGAVLESVFGAEHAPAAWLSAFREHERLIVDTARQRLAAEPTMEPVLLREHHLPHRELPRTVRVAPGTVQRL
jgi:hypothetical protein